MLYPQNSDRIVAIDFVTSLNSPYVLAPSRGVVLKKEVRGRLKQDLDKDFKQFRPTYMLY